MRTLVRLLRCRQGVTAVEFALTLPLLALTLVGLVEFGLAVNEKMRLVSASRAGAQYGYASSTDTAAVTQAVTDAAGIVNPVTVAVATSCGCADGSAVACDAACGDGSQRRSYVTVTVTESWPMIFQFPGFTDPLTLSSTTTMRTN